MCIACELGYWSMIDALEAEQAITKKRARVDDSFACEASSEQPKQPTGEPAP